MRPLLWVLCGVLLSLPASALAAGGPISPQQGGVGAAAPGGKVTYIAVGAGNRTVIESVRRAGGAVERFTSLRGSFGVPGVASDGSATGLSADGRTLVLSGGVGRYPILRTHLVVLDALHLRTRARIDLPGWFNVDAISPPGAGSTSSTIRRLATPVATRSAPTTWPSVAWWPSRSSTPASPTRRCRASR